MKSIQFSTGVREYAINGDETNVIRINIADMNLPARMKAVGRKLDELSAEFGDQPVTPETAAEVDARIRAIMNEAFGTDICTPAFGSTNCMTPVDAEGTLLWQAFFRAFMAQIKEDIAAMRPQQPAVPAVSPKVQHVSPEAKLCSLSQTNLQQYVSSAPAPAVQPVVGMSNANSLDISALTAEQKHRLITALLA